MNNPSRVAFVREQMSKYPETPRVCIKIPKWVHLMGKNITIRPYAVVGGEGFGIECVDGELVHIPHIGGVAIGDNVYICSLAHIARGTVEDTVIESGTKIDALVHIAHNVWVGKDCIITAQSVIGGSCELGDRVYVGLNSTIKDHVKIADDVFIGCGSNVVHDITEPNTVWVGNPARKVRERRQSDG